MSISFPKQNATTRHFTLGVPRSFALSANGQRVFFLRSRAGDDPANCLWMIDLAAGGKEQLVVDPIHITSNNNSDIPEAEKRRRERMRELGSGLVSFSIDDAGNTVAFVLGGDLYIAYPDEAVFVLVGGVSVYDPRISPDGKRVAYVVDGALYTSYIDLGARPQLLAQDNHLDVTWGQADFIASEEIHRTRGYWWSPDSGTIVASKVDNRPVQTVRITNPADPSANVDETKYPFAGTPNAVTELALIHVADGAHTPITWDMAAYPYVIDVDWNKHLLITVQSRDQKQVRILKVNKNGTTTLVRTITNKQWVELVPGSPRQNTSGHIIHTTDAVYRNLAIDGTVVTPPDLHVAAIAGVLADDSVVFTAYDGPRTVHTWALAPDGTLSQLTKGEGLFYPITRGDTCIIRAHTLQSSHAAAHIYQKQNGEWRQVATIASHAATPVVKPRPNFYVSQKRAIQTALLLPHNYDGKSKLPVLLDPYGGPGSNMVVAAQAAYREAQWLANQGFAVVIADGRGTPGRDIAWEKAIAGDLIGPVLEDQIEALQSLALADDRLDTSRVAIRGWSFGGYLAAYAVVRHPNIFHAAIAGAPVTEWRMYDTHYTERYLGDPATNKAAYDGCSLLQEAHKLERPLLLIHGFADDNVLVAHTLQFSAALLAYGKAHQVLPLSNTTHMPSQPEVAEHLMTLQLDFLRRHLLTKNS